MKRHSSSSDLDYFNAGIPPWLIANPANEDLYIVYYSGITGTANSGIFFVRSTNAGVNWDAPIKVNSDTNVTDHWHPSVTLKPDGTRVFIAWYDRRGDPASNSLIQAYGAFASVPVTTNSFSTNFLISTAQFPPVFSGIINTNVGTYDPAYPPKFSTNDDRYCGSFAGFYAPHIGDYDTAVSDNNFVYYSWSDGRNTCTNGGVIRNQADIRFIRVSWPK
ncbi:MAG TPA: hypothetical protein VK615_17015 [Candidatus Binatia bacterium]|nr:hypothetical protein [Candidatus Binatia bacterium]